MRAVQGTHLGGVADTALSLQPAGKHNGNQQGAIEMHASLKQIAPLCLVLLFGNANATLQGRDLDGNVANGAEAYFDTVLGITWLGDANYAKTSGYHIDGAMTWNFAQTWAAGLNFNGTTNWRLPTLTPINGVAFQYFDWADQFSGYRDESFNITSPNSELAYMFGVNLANLSQYDTSGVARPGGSGTDWGVVNVGPFKNLQNSVYWAGVEYEPNINESWDFHMNAGFQTSDPKGYPLLAWAVHPGDVGVSMVPEPEAIALWLAGLLVLGWVMKRSER